MVTVQAFTSFCASKQMGGGGARERNEPDQSTDMTIYTHGHYHCFKQSSKFLRASPFLQGITLKSVLCSGGRGVGILGRSPSLVFYHSCQEAFQESWQQPHHTFRPPQFFGKKLSMHARGGGGRGLRCKKEVLDEAALPRARERARVHVDAAFAPGQRDGLDLNLPEKASSAAREACWEGFRAARPLKNQPGVRSEADGDAIGG